MEKDDEFADLTPSRILLYGCGFELAMAIVAMGLGWFNEVDPRELIPMPAQSSRILWGTLWGVLAAVPWMLSLIVLTHLPWKWIQDLFDTSIHVLKYLEPLSLGELAVLAASAGVGEELLFRGWLQMTLSGSVSEWNFASVTSAIIFSSIAFGFAHAISKTYILFAFTMSVYLGVLFVLTGNLLAPIVAHGVYDFFALAMLKRELRENPSTPQDGA